MAYSEETNAVILKPECGGRAAGAVRADGGAGGAGAGGRRAGCGALWRVAAAEACGSALLVALTCLPGCAGPPPPLARALAAGLAVALLVQCFDHVSGAHLNPAVTLCAALARVVSPARASAELAAQLAGALLGAAAVRALSPAALRRCVTEPAEFISDYQALAVEALLGACLALANLSAWDACNRRLLDSWPLRAGLAVAALALAAGDLTGAGMNPARCAAPAALAGRWASLWVYCVGPPAGAGGAAVLYGCVWRAPAAAAPRPASPAPRRAPPPAPPAPLAPV